jgi:hypothetical protein
MRAKHLRHQLYRKHFVTLAFSDNEKISPQGTISPDPSVNI